MKYLKIMICILVIVLSLSFISCGKQTNTTTTSKIAEVTTTTSKTTTTATTTVKGLWDEDNLEARTREIVGLDTTTQTSMATQDNTNGELLNLLNYNDKREYGYITVEGEVKNISSEKLENVLAIALFYDADDNFITSGEALIQYNPVMPDQTSPFTVMATDNPLIKRYRVEFQFMFGGEIPTINSKHK